MFKGKLQFSLVLLLSAFNLIAQDSDWQRAVEIHRSSWLENRDQLFASEAPTLLRELRGFMQSVRADLGSCEGDLECLEERYVERTSSFYVNEIGPGRITGILRGVDRLIFRYLHVKSDGGLLDMTFHVRPDWVYFPTYDCGGDLCMKEQMLYYHDTLGLGLVVAVSIHNEEEVLFRSFNQDNRLLQGVLLTELVPTLPGCLKNEDFCVGHSIPHPEEERVSGHITSIDMRQGTMEASFQNGDVFSALTPDQLPGSPLDYLELCPLLSSFGASCATTDLKDERRDKWWTEKVSGHERSFWRWILSITRDGVPQGFNP